MLVASTRLRGRRCAAALGLALAATAAVLFPAADAGAAKTGPNAIVFKIQTSQGIRGEIIYGERRHQVIVEVDVITYCTNDMGSFTRQPEVNNDGRTRGNAFSDVEYNPLSTPTEWEKWTASADFRPPGRKRGFPRWRKTTGTVQFTSSLQAFENEKCDSGPVSFVTTSARRTILPL